MAALAVPVRADDASAWDGDSRSAARLIGGRTSQSATPTIRAGVEIRMKPGWKTYWRYPGDSGVPPRFDFSGSENLRAAIVTWPAPQRFYDSEGQTIGYKSHVVLPLRVEAENPQKPVFLRLKLDYAICEKLCVPAEAKSELTLSEISPAQGALLDESEKRVPKKLELGGTGPLAIAKVTRDANETPAKILVDVTAMSGTPVDLFAEGPGANWALPLPTPVAGAPPGQQRFMFLLDGLPPGTQAVGATLTLTATSGDRAIETNFRID